MILSREKRLILHQWAWHYSSGHREVMTFAGNCTPDSIIIVNGQHIYVPGTLSERTDGNAQMMIYV